MPKHKILNDPDILEEGKPLIVTIANKTLVVSSVDAKIGFLPLKQFREL